MKILSKLKLNKKENIIILIISLLVGMVYFLPYLFFAYYSDFKILLLSLDAESVYLTLIRDIWEGYTNPVSPYFYEYKNITGHVFQYGTVIFGNFAKILHIAPNYFFIYSKLFFPILTFLLWYRFSLIFMRDKLFSIFSALLFIFAYGLIDNPNIIDNLKILLMQSNNVELLLYSRFVNPMLTFPILIGGMILLYLFFNKQNFKHSVFLGISLGISFYFYFYFWVFLWVVLFCLGVYFLINKDWKAIKYILLSSLIAILLGIPFFFSLFSSLYSGTAQILNVTFPFILKRDFIFSKILSLGIVLYAIYFLIKIKKHILHKADIFLGLLLVASILSLNQHVLTNRYIQANHFHWYINIPIFTLMLSLFLKELFSYIKHSYIIKSLIILFSLLVFIYGIGTQVSGFKKNTERLDIFNEQAELFAWLNNNSDKDSVILTSDELSNFIPAYTHNNVYFSSQAVYNKSYPYERRIFNTLVYYHLKYRDNEDTNTVFYDNKGEIGAIGLPITFYKNSCGAYDCYPDYYLDTLIDEYEQFKDNNFKEELLKYRLDYIIWDIDNDPSWNLEEFEFLKEEGSINNFKIYSL